MLPSDHRAPFVRVGASSSTLAPPARARGARRFYPFPGRRSLDPRHRSTSSPQVRSHVFRFPPRCVHREPGATTVGAPGSQRIPHRFAGGPLPSAKPLFPNQYNVAFSRTHAESTLVQLPDTDAPSSGTMDSEGKGPASAPGTQLRGGLLAQTRFQISPLIVEPRAPITTNVASGEARSKGGPRVVKPGALGLPTPSPFLTLQACDSPRRSLSRESITSSGARA